MVDFDYLVQEKLKSNKYMIEYQGYSSDAGEATVYLRGKMKNNGRFRKTTAFYQLNLSQDL